MDSHRSPSPHPSSARHTPDNAISQPVILNNLASTSQSQPNTFENSFDFAPTSQSLFPEQNFSPGDTSGIGFEPSNQSNAFPNFDFDTAGSLNDPSFDAPLFTTSADNQSFLHAVALDPALLGTQVSHQSIPTQNHNVDQMATLAPTMQQHHGGSPHGSPLLGHNSFQNTATNHSRNTSLDPASAAFPMHNNEWGASPAFQGHRRTFSDAHSDISSAQHSPYMPAADNFDQPIQHSPHMGTQDPAMFQDVLAIGQVSLSEANQSYISPAPSPHISPRLPPTQHSPQPYPIDGFSLMPQHLPQQFNNMNMYPNAYPSPGQEAFPNLNQATDIHGSDRPTPDIKIQLAPPSRQATFETENQGPIKDAAALSPPEKARGRSNTAPSSSRGSTPQRDTLSPHAAGVGSRSPSPAGKNRRSSTSSVPNRDYILDLADPNRPSSNHSETSGSAKRTQKHPATFQCSLCPKRFTRAYNLRSHLRTHTDERPFVCGHCGKAFARQHDRKRHEGLHSGEKKFVCRGSLKDASNWGCGRRFARADALGRHFRSEAGRLCIKPLMDEEALEHGVAQPNDVGAPGAGIMAGLNMQQGVPMQVPYGYNVSGPDSYQSGMPIHYQTAMALPRALLTQYPALGGIWDQLPSNGPEDMDDGGIPSRGSFSSAGDFDDEDWNGSNGGGQALGWASDVGP